MALRQGETGKVFRVGASFDMATNTALTLTFTKPDGTTVTKTEAAGEVVLGTVPIIDPDIGSLLANQYVVYIVEVGFLDQAGLWSGCLTYGDDLPDIPHVYIGDSFTFSVSTAC